MQRHHRAEALRNVHPHCLPEAVQDTFQNPTVNLPIHLR